MYALRNAIALGVLVIASLSACQTEATAQYVTTAFGLSRPQLLLPVYRQHVWTVDMRQGDGDPRRHTCLSGVFARDAAYYPFHDHIDFGSLQHVDRFLSDGRGGYYHQRGFIWLSHGEYRESTVWTHYQRIGSLRP